MTDDRRYRSKRWRRVRLLVLARDNWTCWNPHCPGRPVNTCDHISPTYPGMPDSEFFGMHNLRASCRVDNVARGVAARLERETSGVVQVAPRRSVFERRRSFKGGGAEDVGSSRVDLQACKLEYSIVSPK